jgi:hypothetical protein
MLENADFPVKFVMMSAQYPTNLQTKLLKVVTHVFEYLKKESQKQIALLTVHRLGPSADLSYLRTVAKLAFSIGNSYGLHENDLGLLRVYC